MTSKSNIVDYTASSFSTRSLSSSVSASCKSDQSTTSNQSSVLTKNRIIKLGNELLLICNTSNPNQTILKLPKYISSIKQFNSNLFIYFYESILGIQLEVKIWPSKSNEDDIHNLQAIIDSLSIDILHEDLSHIQASAIFNSKPDLLSLEYLLDILKTIQEWISSRLDSMNSSSNTSKYNSSLSRFSSIRIPNQTQKSFKSELTNKSKENRPNRNGSLSRNSSTTSVSSLSNISSTLSSSTSTINSSRNKTNNMKSNTARKSSIEPEKSTNKLQSKNSIAINNQDSKKHKLSNFNLARSSSTPRSTVRPNSNFNPRPSAQSRNLDFRSNRSSSISSLNSSGTTLNRSNSSRSLSSTRNQSFSENLGENSILASLLNEFPNIPTKTLNDIWSKYSKQINCFNKIEQLNKESYLSSNQRDSKLERYLKEAYHKQKLLVELMKKEMVLAQRLENIKKSKEAENLEKAKIRERRLENARIKKYYDEIRMQEKSKMLQQKTHEELVYKQNLAESLKIKKDTILELKKYNREKSEQNLNRQKLHMESIENLYKTKFDLLNEQMRKERETYKVRDKAQNLMFSKMKNQVKSQLEIDLNILQEQFYRENDFKIDSQLTNIGYCSKFSNLS